MTKTELDQIRMFGCTKADLKESAESSITFSFSGAGMLSMNYLSDAQEMMARGHVEQARQTINCAKFFIAEYLIPERG